MILAIDPGINNCGLALIDIENNFNVKETYLVKNARKFTDEEKIIEAKFGSRSVKVLAILNKINELLNTYKNIDTIIIEAPFYNALTPMAYGSLLEVIFSIKYSIILNRDLKFKLIEPLLIKKLFANQGQTSKEVMKQFLIKKQKNKDILIEKNIEEMSEHEVDSVAIGFVHYLSILEERINYVSSN